MQLHRRWERKWVESWLDAQDYDWTLNHWLHENFPFYILSNWILISESTKIGWFTRCQLVRFPLHPDDKRRHKKLPRIKVVWKRIGQMDNNGNKNCSQFPSEILAVPFLGTLLRNNTTPTFVHGITFLQFYWFTFFSKFPYSF